MERTTVEGLAPALVACIEDRNRTVSINALQLLGQLGPPDAQSTFLRLIEGDDIELRSWAASGLKKLQRCGADLLEPLLGAFQSEDWSVRVDACETLYRLENVHDLAVSRLLDALAGLTALDDHLTIHSTA